MWRLMAVVLVWAAVAYKLVRVLAAPTVANRTLLAMLTYPAIAATVIVPPVYRWVGKTSGSPNLGVLIATSTGLLGLVPCLNILLHRHEPLEVAHAKARRRYAFVGGLVLFQATLWAATPAGPSDPLFGLTRVDDPLVVAYLMVHQGALAAACVVCFVQCRLMARKADGPLRVGLWLVAVSGLAGDLVVAWNVGYYASVLRGGPIRAQGWGLLSVWLVYASVCALAVGVTAPDWAPRLARQVEGHRQLRSLEPIWRTLLAAAPEVELEHAYSRWDVGHRLHRRVVEIHDAELALRQRLGGNANQDEPDDQSVLRATPLAQAIREGGLEVSLRPAPDDLRSEVAFLLRMAAAVDPAMARSSRLSRLVRRWSRPRAPGAAI